MGILYLPAPRNLLDRISVPPGAVYYQVSVCESLLVDGQLRAERKETGLSSALRFIVLPGMS